MSDHSETWGRPALYMMRDRWEAGCRERGRPVTPIGEGAALDAGEVDWRHARLLELVDAANYHWCELAERHGSSNPDDWPERARYDLQQSVYAIELLRARVNRERRELGEAR